MKSIKILISFIAIGLLFSNCKPILYTYYGVHSPRVETDASLIKYCRKKKLQTENILRPKDTGAFKIILKENNSVPELRVFNASGEQLVYRNAAECNAKAFNLTQVFCDTIQSISTFNERINLNNELEKLRWVGNPNKQWKEQHADYTVLIYWGKWSGRLNKDHVRIWERQLDTASCRVKVYKVSTDLIP